MSSPLAFDDIQTRKNELIRKALEGATFAAPETADPIASLTTGAASGLTALPTGYEDVGWHTTDGVALSEAITTSDTSSWGSAQPTRSDITSSVTTVKIVPQETNKTTIELYTGVDLSAVDGDHVTSEVSFEKPLVPPARYWRVLCLAVDLSDAGEIYVARFLPRARVTDMDDQTYAASDDNGITWGVTMTAFEDSTLGYAQKFFFGGPGWAAILTDAGFTLASS